MGRWLMLGALLVTAGISCSPDSAPDRGIDVRLVDAPALLAHLYVDLTGIAVQGPTTGWITQAADLRELDVLSLVGGMDAQLGRIKLPAGEYNQLRLEFGPRSRAVLTDGTEVRLDVPSGQLQIKGHWEVQNGFWTRITIDFLPAASVVETSKGFSLKPVIRIKSTELVPSWGPDPRDNSYTAVVGPEGGDVSLTDGSGVEVPPGALASTETITVQRLSPELRQAPVVTGTALLGGITLLPDGLSFVTPVTVNAPLFTEVTPGRMVVPLVYDAAAVKWVPEVSFSDGTSAAVVLPNGLVAVPAQHFSSRGAAPAPAEIYQGTPISKMADPSLPLQNLGSPGGSPLWGIYSMRADTVLNGPPGSPIPGMNDYQTRKSRYKDALIDLLFRVGLENGEVHDTVSAVFESAAFVADSAALGADGSILLQANDAGLRIARTLDGALQGNLTTYKFTNLQYVVKHLEKVSQHLGGAALTLRISTNFATMITSAVVATGLEKDRADRLDKIFKQSPLINDPAFNEAWSQVRLDLGAQSDAQLLWIGQTLQTAEYDVAATDTVVALFLEKATPAAAEALVRAGIISSVARSNCLVAFAAYAVDAFISDVLRAHQLECHAVAALSIWQNAFARSSMVDPVLEQERRLSGAYMGFRAADLTAQFYFNVDASMASRSALWLVEQLSESVRQRREALANNLRLVKSLHQERYAVHFTDWTDPLAEGPYRGYFRTVEESDIFAFTASGPAQYWHDASYGSGGAMLWTYNNAIGSGIGVQNQGEWRFTAPVDGTYRIRVHVPSNYATARACYEVRGDGRVSYYVVRQERYFDQWVTLGTQWFPAEAAISVVLTDLTADAHLSKWIGYDAVRIEEAFDTMPQIPNTVGCGEDPVQPPARFTYGVQYPIPGGPFTEAKDTDGWYLAQDFGDSSWNGQAHLGEDWNSEECATCDKGKPIVAPGNGEIIYADQRAGWRGAVMIRLVTAGEAFLIPGGGFSSEVVVLLGHLDENRLLVHKGQTVLGGDLLGYIGESPCSGPGCGPHLHLEVRLPTDTQEWVPGPGYNILGAGFLGRVNPAEFFAINPPG